MKNSGYLDLPPRTLITVWYSAVDGYQENKDFVELADAQAWANHWIGECPSLGGYYAVSDDGIGKIEVRGCTLTELFPKGF